MYDILLMQRQKLTGRVMPMKRDQNSNTETRVRPYAEAPTMTPRIHQMELVDMSRYTRGTDWVLVLWAT